jgi:small multidrug resistance pump
MTWFLLAIAILAEIVGTLLLKRSEGFTKLWPSIGVVFGYLTAFALLSQSLKKIDVGITYAIWSGFGIIGAAVGGLIFFDQQLSKLNIIGITIIIAGVVIMNAGGVSH